jgi:O-antigen/teichoic acid export membrane protein
MPEELDIEKNNKTRSSNPTEDNNPLSGIAIEEKSDDYVVTAAKGSGIMTFGKLVEYVGRFAIAFLLARILGAEQYGLYSLALSAAAILTTLSLLGMDDAILRNVAVSKSRNDDQSLWGMLQLTFGFTFLASVISGIVLYIFAEPIAEVIFSEPLLTPMLQLVAIIIPMLTLGEMLLSATQGFKRMEYGVIARDFVQGPFRLVLLCILALINLNAFTAMITFGIADLTGSIALVYFLNKEFPLKRSPSDSKRDVRGLLAFSFPFWFSDVLNTVRKNIQVMMLGSLSTITSAGIFTIVDRVNLISIITYRSVQTSIRPIIAELQSKDRWQDIEHLYQTSTRWGLLVNIPMTLIMVLFSEEILLIFGESFVEGGLALTVLALAEFVKVLTGMSGTIIDMSGLNRLKLVNSIFQVVLAVGINVYLIPRWGLMGAAAAGFISISVMNLLRMIEVFIVYRILPFNRMLIKPFAAGTAALITVLILGTLIDVERNLVTLIIGVALVIAIYSGVLYIQGLPEDDRLVIKRTINKIKKSTSEILMFINRRRNSNSM